MTESPSTAAEHGDGPAPKASIVVPSRGGAVRLPHLLAALRAQTEPSWEAIVVIDGDVDDSESVVAAAAANGDPVRAIVFPENRGRAAALNAGFAAARGDVLIRSDDDMRPRPEWLAGHLAAHAEEFAGGAPAGAIALPINIYPPTPYSRAYGAERNGRFRQEAYAVAPERQWRYWGGNVSVSRASFERVGPYDESFRAYGWEDVEWGYRAAQAGVQVRLHPELETPHHIAATTTEIRVARAYLSGAARRRFEAKHGREAHGTEAPARGTWNRLVAGTAKVLGLPALRRAARFADRTADLLPKYLAEKQISLLVEAAGRSGGIRAETEQGQHRARAVERSGALHATEPGGRLRTTARPLRIALVTPWRLEDPRAWSGMIPRIVEALERDAEIVPVSTSEVTTAVPDRIAAKVLGRLSKKTYLWDFGLATARKRGHALRPRILAADPDVVLAVVASTDVAYLGDLPAPIVQVSDATFAAIKGFYPMFSNLHPLSAAQASRVTERATRATSAFVVSSEWARDSLVHDYAVGTHQVVVAPTGPGILPADGAARAPADPGRPMRVLMVASDWHRKGGGLALDAMAIARDRGLDAELVVVGDAPESLPERATPLGRLDAAALSLEYLRADVLLELADANAAGVTLTDAAAHGLPVIATAVGGVPSIVLHERTGLLLPPGADLADRTAAALLELADAEKRARLGATAKARFDDELSWDVWAGRALAACRMVL